MACPGPFVGLWAGQASGASARRLRRPSSRVLARDRYGGTSSVRVRGLGPVASTADPRWSGRVAWRSRAIGRVANPLSAGIDARTRLHLSSIDGATIPPDSVGCDHQDVTAAGAGTALPADVQPLRRARDRELSAGIDARTRLHLSSIDGATIPPDSVGWR
jgi:hypothetical protein